MKNLFLLLVFVVLNCSQLSAATLNFNEVAPGSTKKVLRFSSVAVSQSNGGALFVYNGGDFGMPGTGGVCGLAAKSSQCTGNVSLLFVGPVSDLTFKGYFAEPVDKATIAAYAGSELLGFLLISGNEGGRVDIDLTGTSGITRLEITSLAGSDGKGIAYGDFEFDVDPPDAPPPVPLPPLYLDLDMLPGGTNPGLIDLGPALLVQSSGGQIYVYRTGDFGMPENGGFCAFETGLGCMGDLVIEFDDAISDLIFSGFFAKRSDAALISLFDGDVLIYTGNFFGNSGGTIQFDFRAVTKLTKIVIQDRSRTTTKGIAYGNFRSKLYEPVAPVPVPGALFLLAASLLALALMRRAPIRRIEAA